MEYMKNIGANKYQKGPPGGHNPPGHTREPRRALGGCALLGPPPMPIFWYISHFYLEKNKENAFGMERCSLEAKLGQEHFCPPVERFCRGNLPPGGGNHRPHHHQQLSHLGRAISINIFNSTISSQTLVHLLCSILLPEL